jgi:hypothetical protein
MSLWFGVIFALCGLALAVLFGIVIYRDPQAKMRSVEISLRDQEAAEKA